MNRAWRLTGCGVRARAGGGRLGAFWFGMAEGDVNHRKPSGW